MMNVSRFARRFAREEDGVLAVEFVIMVPVLFWAYLTLFSIFDAYREHAVNQKVAYSIGDIISRETNPLDEDYLKGMVSLATYMSKVGSKSDVTLRVTSIRWNGQQQRYERVWSQAKGSRPALPEGQVSGMANMLPVLPHNEEIMVVETYIKYDPPFNIGLQSREISNMVFTRPRYASKVCWEICDPGGNVEGEEGGA